MTLEGSDRRMRIRDNLSKPYDIEEALRQGDSVATIPFNVLLEAAVRCKNMDTNTIISDDLDIIDG